MILNIQNLKASIADSDKEILHGINLQINPGEVHAIMGPNGSGKSTLANVLAGRSDYEVTDGTIEYCGKNLFDLSPEERAQQGLFLSFQYPIEIPGVNNMVFLRTSVNAIRKARGESPLDAMDFIKIAKQKVKEIGLDESFLQRPVNTGFSGGEKKRNEILQMILLEPKLMILDETDSGLDIDALKIVADGVNSMRGKDKSILLVTHYQRLLDYIEPDFVHVLMKGKIVKSGDKSLALELEEKGYGWLSEKGEA